MVCGVVSEVTGVLETLEYSLTTFGRKGMFTCVRRSLYFGPAVNLLGPLGDDALRACERFL